MQGALHFVGFKDGDLQFHRAVHVFGAPDFIHRIWDTRAQQEIVDGDIAVFANGFGNSEPSANAWDASAVECSWCKCVAGQCKNRKPLA